MKHLLWTSTLLGLLAAPPAAAQAAHVLIVAGQSNAVGIGANAALLGPGLSAPTPDIGYWWQIEGVDGPGLQALRPQADTMDASVFDAFFGPELTAARAIHTAVPDEQLVVLKVATNGTDLARHWDPDDPSSLYADLVDEYAALSAELVALGYTPQPVGVLWMQGENDAARRIDADAYEVNLTEFIARLRTDVAEPDLPFVIGRIHADLLIIYGRYKGRVRAAQAAVAAADPNAELVDLDDLPLLADQIHFDDEGMRAMGKRFAVALGGLVAP